MPALAFGDLFVQASVFHGDWRSAARAGISSAHVVLGEVAHPLALEVHHAHHPVVVTMSGTATSERMSGCDAM